nr:EOG090X06BA [Macrothrix elegans]
MVSEGYAKAIEKINSNDSSGIQDLIKNHDVEIEAEDEHGMTLLQQAAFKGRKDITQLLLDLGANPNGGHHEHQYTALHFAALSGNIDICQQLLHYGAKADVLNSVARTPSQMAAFVGNHSVVSVINNFIPKDEIEHYTISTSSQVEPKLPHSVAPALHKFVMQVNLHPVHLLFTVQKLPLLFDNLSRVKEVLEFMCDRQMKRDQEANEILSLKFHYLRFLVDRLEKEKNIDKSFPECISHLAKIFLKQNNDGFPEYMDNFVREAVRTFPYKETTIFRQLLASLSKIRQNSESTLALTLFSSCINGQRGFHDDDACAACGEEKVPSKCSKCKSIQYCDRNCQKIHWFVHKRQCENLAKQRKDNHIQSQKHRETEKNLAI